jgi:putative membrane protein
VLLFVALLEHRVIVLGDTGVDTLLDPDESWSDVVATVLSRVGGGELCDGLVRGVQKIGDILARHLPAPPRNVDELPTALVIEER